MISLFSYCEISWWCVLCAWLLPFLLGLLLGWLLWAKFKNLYASLKAEYDEYRLKCRNTEEELQKCLSKQNSYVSDIALLKGRLKECEENAAKADSDDAGAQRLAVAGTVAGTVKEDSTVKEDAGVTYQGISADKFAALKEDNLQVIEGIGPKMNEFLRKHGIVTWSDLAQKTPEELKALLDKEGNKYKIIDPSTWPQQAALARDGKWEELIALQKKLDTGRKGKSHTSAETESKVEKILIKMGVLKRWEKDDLKAIEGIGPKIEKLLHAAGIKTWEQLAATPVSKLQEILNNAGKRYALADPSTWPKQAKLAAEGRFAELEEYQDYLKGGREVN